jgi:signal transduction histidine kinase
MMSIALTNTDRLLRLINELLDLERLNSGAASLAPADHDAGQLMQQATDGIRLLAEQSKVTINVVGTHLRVWCDGDRMVQVLTNLVGNAIKFSPTGSSIWLQVEAAPDEIIFRVRDQGRGIPASKLETIFDPFSQLEEGDARAKGGTGLGLAISRSIVTQHGGHIWAESAIGSGTTIFVAIPHHDVASAAEAA